MYDPAFDLMSLLNRTLSDPEALRPASLESWNDYGHEQDQVHMDSTDTTNSWRPHRTSHLAQPDRPHAAFTHNRRFKKSGVTAVHIPPHPQAPSDTAITQPLMIKGPLEPLEPHTRSLEVLLQPLEQQPSDVETKCGLAFWKRLCSN